MEQHHYSTEIPLVNFHWFRVVRRERWSSVCYQVHWRLRFGKLSTSRRVINDSELGANEGKKQSAIFLRQRFITKVTWNPIRRDISVIKEAGDLEEFKRWLTRHYPGIEIPLDMPARAGASKIVNGMMLVAVVTAVLGGLTRFQVGIPSHACWLLLWMYGGPVFRWKWLIADSMDKEACLSFLKWSIFECCRVLAVVIAIGVYGGITVISVELLGAFCETTISMPAWKWIVVGLLILFGLSLIGLIISFSGDVFGILIYDQGFD